MHILPQLNFAWLLVVPAAFAVWRARAAARPALFSCCAALALFCALAGLTPTAPGAATAAPPAQDSSHATLRSNSSFAIADFDGDQRPDLATAEIERSNPRFTRYLIRLQLAAGPGQHGPSGQFIGVTGAFGLPQISAIDVNGDHALDLVLTAAGQQQPIAILLNDGRGKFSLANPRDFPAAAVDSPWHWGSASHPFQDLAVLTPTRAPQADSRNAGHLLAPRHLAELRFSRSRGFRPDPLHASPLGRAPPQLA
jgi:VCBS repeat protein